MFPSGQILSYESPDFLIVSKFETIGIELSQIHHLPQEGKAPLRLLESEHQRIVDLAQSTYEDMGLTPTTVSVVFNPSFSPRKQDGRRLKQLLISLVLRNLPTEQNGGFEEYTGFNSGYFPSEVAAIFVDRQSPDSGSFWSASQSSSVPTLSSGRIQTEITQKDIKRFHYDSRCDQQWLVLIVSGGNLSNYFLLTDELFSHQYTHGFDKVLLFDHPNRVLDLE